MKIQDLDGVAYDRALAWLAEVAVEYEWWDFIYDDIKNAGDLMGIDVEEIFFTLNPVGVGLGGTYYYKKGGVKAVTLEFPRDHTLLRIAHDLQDIQKRNFYQLMTSFRSSSRGTSTEVWEVERDDEYAAPTADAEDAVEDALQEFVGWAGTQLDEGYDYLTSEEMLLENADANRYEFDEDGYLE